LAQVDTSRIAPESGETPAERVSTRALPGAAFLTQLIAEYEHLPPQRTRRRAPMAEVLRIYDAGDRIADRRLPPGYRKSIEA
jgi:hypothetical protein